MVAMFLDCLSAQRVGRHFFRLGRANGFKPNVSLPTLDLPMTLPFQVRDERGKVPRFSACGNVSAKKLSAIP
jgi:hypothetical protein